MEGQGQGQSEGNASGAPSTPRGGGPSSLTGSHVGGAPMDARELVPMPPPGHRAGRGAPRARQSRLSRASSLEASLIGELSSEGYLAAAPPAPSACYAATSLTPSLSHSLVPAHAHSTGSQATSHSFHARGEARASPINRTSSGTDYQLRAMGVPEGVWGQYQGEGDLPFASSQLRTSSATEHQLRALGIPEGEAIQHRGEGELPRSPMGRASSATDRQLRAMGMPDGGGYTAGAPGRGVPWVGGRGGANGGAAQQLRSRLGRASSATERQMRAMGMPGRYEGEAPQQHQQQHQQQQQEQQQQQQQHHRRSALGRASSATEHQLRALVIPEDAPMQRQEEWGPPSGYLETGYAGGVPDGTPVQQHREGPGPFPGRLGRAPAGRGYADGVPEGWEGMHGRIGRASSLDVERAWKPGAELAGAGADEAFEGSAFGSSPSRNLPPLPLHGSSPLRRIQKSTSASIVPSAAGGYEALEPAPKGFCAGSSAAGAGFSPSPAGGKGESSQRGGEKAVHLGHTSSLEDSFTSLEADMLPALPPIGEGKGSGHRAALKGSVAPRRVKSADDRTSTNTNSHVAHASERDRRSLSGVRDPYFDRAEDCTVLDNASDRAFLPDPPGAGSPGSGALSWASLDVPQVGQPPPFTAGISLINRDSNSASHDGKNSTTANVRDNLPGTPTEYRPPVRPRRPVIVAREGIQRTSSECVQALHAWPSNANLSCEDDNDMGSTPGAVHGSRGWGAEYGHYSPGSPSNYGYTTLKEGDTSTSFTDSATRAETHNDTVMSNSTSGVYPGGVPGEGRGPSGQAPGVPRGLRRATPQEQLRGGGLARTSSAQLPASWKVGPGDFEGDFPSVQVPSRARGIPGAGGAGARRALGVAALRKQAALRLAAAGMPGSADPGPLGSPGVPGLHQVGGSSNSREGLADAGEGGMFGVPLASPMPSLGPGHPLVRSDLTPLKGAHGVEALGAMGMGTVRGLRGGVPHLRGHGLHWGGGKGGFVGNETGVSPDSSDAGGSSPNHSYLEFVSPRVTMGYAGYGGYTRRGEEEGDQSLQWARARLMMSATGGGGSGDISGLMSAGSREGGEIDGVIGQGRGGMVASGTHLLTLAGSSGLTEAEVDSAATGAGAGAVAGAGAGRGLSGREASGSGAGAAGGLASLLSAAPDASGRVPSPSGGEPAVYPAVNPAQNWAAAHATDQGASAVHRDMQPTAGGVPTSRGCTGSQGLLGSDPASVSASAAPEVGDAGAAVADVRDAAPLALVARVRRVGDGRTEGQGEKGLEGSREMRGALAATLEEAHGIGGTMGIPGGSERNGGDVREGGGGGGGGGGHEEGREGSGVGNERRERTRDVVGANSGSGSGSGAGARPGGSQSSPLIAAPPEAPSSPLPGEGRSHPQARAPPRGADPREDSGLSQRTRRRAAMRDHVLRIEYADICSDFVVASKEIGSGQFGHIRKCVERATGQQYACKTVHKISIRSPKDAEDLRHEVHCLKKLRGHPSVITLKHAAEDEKSVHLVMDLCKGGDLFDRIKKRGPVPERCAARILRALTEALIACHSLGIIHRDIKPENVLLTDRDPECHTVKLIDFGIAAPYRPGVICDEIMGTPFYMAPEVYRRRYGPACDFWSLGVVLFLMVSGVPPFWPKKGLDVAHDVLHGRLRFNHPNWAEISKPCIDLVRRMLDKDPITRITGAEILEHEWITAHGI